MRRQQKGSGEGGRKEKDEETVRKEMDNTIMSTHVDDTRIYRVVVVAVVVVAAAATYRANRLRRLNLAICS